MFFPLALLHLSLQRGYQRKYIFHELPIEEDGYPGGNANHVELIAEKTTSVQSIDADNSTAVQGGAEGTKSAKGKNNKGIVRQLRVLVPQEQDFSRNSISGRVTDKPLSDIDSTSGFSSRPKPLKKFNISDADNVKDKVENLMLAGNDMVFDKHECEDSPKCGCREHKNIMAKCAKLEKYGPLYCRKCCNQCGTFYISTMTGVKQISMVIFHKFNLARFVMRDFSNVYASEMVIDNRDGKWGLYFIDAAQGTLNVIGGDGSVIMLYKYRKSESEESWKRWNGHLTLGEPGVLYATHTKDRVVQKIPLHHDKGIPKVHEEKVETIKKKLIHPTRITYDRVKKALYVASKEGIIEIPVHNPDDSAIFARVNDANIVAMVSDSNTGDVLYATQTGYVCRKRATGELVEMDSVSLPNNTQIRNIFQNAESGQICLLVQGNASKIECVVDKEFTYGEEYIGGCNVINPDGTQEEAMVQASTSQITRTPSPSRDTGGHVSSTSTPMPAVLPVSTRTPSTLTLITTPVSTTVPPKQEDIPHPRKTDSGDAGSSTTFHAGSHPKKAPGDKHTSRKKPIVGGNVFPKNEKYILAEEQAVATMTKGPSPRKSPSPTEWDLKTMGGFQAEDDPAKGENPKKEVNPKNGGDFAKEDDSAKENRLETGGPTSKWTSEEEEGASPAKVSSTTEAKKDGARARFLPNNQTAPKRQKKDTAPQTKTAQIPHNQGYAAPPKNSAQIPQHQGSYPQPLVPLEEIPEAGDFTDLIEDETLPAGASEEDIIASPLVAIGTPTQSKTAYPTRAKAQASSNSILPNTIKKSPTFPLPATAKDDSDSMGGLDVIYCIVFAMCALLVAFVVVYSALNCVGRRLDEARQSTTSGMSSSHSRSTLPAMY